MSYVEVLGKALLSAKGEEKIRIANALRELEDSRAEPYLLEVLDSRNKYVREAAAFALSFAALANFLAETSCSVTWAVYFFASLIEDIVSPAKNTI